MTDQEKREKVVKGLERIRDYDPMFRVTHDDEFSQYAADALALLKAPAIDAIPVEWLREKANGNDFVIGRAARFVLRAWEQETQKLGLEPKEG